MRARTASSVLAALLAAAVVPSAASAASCARAEAVRVPGAEVRATACLDDLTTAGTEASGHTVRRDWQGLHAAGTRNPSGIPGLQVDGWFPDGSRTNTTGGEAHDSQWVIRLPNRWNGKLVVTGAPGGRGQYANDFIIGDWVLARGYAFASTDKGNTGATFFQDGIAPGDAVAEWHRRLRQLTRAAKGSVRRHYARAPTRTYVTGISNGGYLTRYALERDPELYDGGVDWEGVLFRAEGPNLLTYLPAALREYPALRSNGSPAAREAILRAGFERGSEFLWESHHALYWDFTQRAYREELDPDYDGALEAGRPFCASGTPACDADYDYASRPRAVKEAVARVSNTGRIGRPMLTLHGTLDALLPIRTDSHVYRRMVRRAGRADLHRYYVISRGNHLDGLYDAHPRRLRPMLPCYRAAFRALEGWVERGRQPPRSGFRPKPARGDLVNTCSLRGPARSSVPTPAGG